MIKEEELTTLLNKYYNKDDVTSILEGYKAHKVSSFRVNTLKASKDEIVKTLELNNIKYKNVDFFKDAFLVEDETSIKSLDIYEEGKIYFQSLSSMVPPLILNPLCKSTILDMAAAPGSKTSEICAITNNSADVIACEINKIRAERLKYNLDKLGCKHVTVMNIDALKLDDFFSFDKILLDAPCSGSGTLSFNDNSLNSFSVALVNNSSKLQLKLLRKAYKMLKKGGELVYSTCSILPIENEEVVNAFMKETNCSLIELKEEDYKDLPFLPSRIKGCLVIKPTKEYEGFFIAKFIKK